ncbi:dephospho-CoA kinase [Absicoccus porci]|jgi:dephospho-CoA kinase|uniref:dephospho-CoA kinase n=1 Tax=Absicoccus porci TaxID=2486576 RepID=UPI003D8BB444
MSILSKKKIIGLTGSMGAGKSQVSKYVAKRYPVLDCDQVNAHLLEKGQKGYQVLVKKALVPLDEKGNIDKVQMAQQMFQVADRKQRIEDLLHPLILNEMQTWAQAQTVSLVFMEVPLLFESHVESMFDSIWCVVTNQDIALDRLQKYRHFTASQAQARLAYQMDPEVKIRKSDVVIYNNAGLDGLYAQVQKALEREESCVGL